MALVEMNFAEGGTHTLDYDGYSDYIGTTRTASFTITGNHDYIQIVSTGVQQNSFVPSHNGITYSWNLNRTDGASNAGASVLIPNVKNGDVITFSDGGITVTGFYGLSYS